MEKTSGWLETHGVKVGEVMDTSRWQEHLVKDKVLAVLLLWPLTQLYDLSYSIHKFVET